MTDPDPDVMTRAMNRYDKAMQDFEKAGGYAAQSEATAMAASLGLPQEVMGQQLGTLSGVNAVVSNWHAFCSLTRIR